MFNILLDKLPTKYEGYPINTDFRIGIQMIQAMYDRSLAKFEKYVMIYNLLFEQEGRTEYPDEITAQNAIDWFLSGWYTDKITEKEKKESKNSKTDVDYDIDQWRIYSAFLTQFGIDLNTVDMHFWVFMGLLSTLDDCAFTRVIDIRTRKIDPKMPPDTKKDLKSIKEKYSLEQDTEDEISPKEKEEYDIFMSYVKPKKNVPTGGIVPADNLKN